LRLLPSYHVQPFGALLRAASARANRSARIGCARQYESIATAASGVCSAILYILQQVWVCFGEAENGMQRAQPLTSKPRVPLVRAASPWIAQLVLRNDLAIGGVYAMKLPTAGAEHRLVSVAIG
jgi:hypothetical protein